MSAPNAPMIEKASAGMREILQSFTTSEARYFDEERFSEAEIRRSLSDSLTEKKTDAMKRILAHVSAGRDASALFPDVVKNVSFQSLELKKLIYIYLVQYAENNRELALLSINSFQKDLSDRSQLVRASALRAMSSIKVLEVIQLVMVAVRTASSDTSPYVRKTAAQCMTKVYGVDPDQFFELRSLLLKLMNDHEVQVVGSAVMAFHHICVTVPPRIPVEASEEQGGGAGADGSAFLGPDAAVRLQLELLHPHFRRFCQDVLLMDPWAQQSCIDLLLRYCRVFFACPDRAKPAQAEGDAAAAPNGASEAPTASEDLATFVKTLRLLLSSSSKGVTLSAVVALCYVAPSEELSCITMPLLRCLRQAPAESVHAILVAFMPILEGRPELMRPSIREFFVQSFDFAGVKELKLKILDRLTDESNVQLVLRELQAYVSWHSQPEFVALAVQTITHVALKISSVADACLRGLVKMLDSKCEALACEAVVALRALLQRRQQSSDSGLGSVLPHLARYLEDLAAPTARASVVWIIGQYQREVPRLAPDVVRRMAKKFASERQEVKQQILGLGLKVWAFHALNARGETNQECKDEAAGSAQQQLSTEESATLLPRLEALVDHISNLASYDVAWDVRDTARALKQLKEAAKAGLAADEGGTQLMALGLWYCRTCVSGKPAAGIGPDDDAKGAAEGGGGEEDGVTSGPFESTWILGSLAQALEFPLDTYRPLPPWAQENSSDELRKVKVEAPKTNIDAPKSISSANIGNVQHMEQRTQNPSNIGALPVVQNLEDLDLFYAEDHTVARAAAATAAAAGGAAGRGGTTAPAPAPTSLEQMTLASTPVQKTVGTAVFGEDDESDEEQESDDDDDWKYCQQASQAAAPAPVASASPTEDGYPPTAEPGAPQQATPTAAVAEVPAPAAEATPAAPAADAPTAATQEAGAATGAAGGGEPPDLL